MRTLVCSIIARSNKLRLSSLVFGLSFIICTSVWGHSIPKDQIGHHVLITVHQDELIIDYTQVLSELFVIRDMIAINQDGDFDNTNAETWQFMSRKADSLISFLTITIDGQVVKLIQDTLVFDVTQVRSFYYKLAYDFQGKHEFKAFNSIKLNKDDRLIYYVMTDSVIELSSIARFGELGVDSLQQIVQEQRGITFSCGTEIKGKSFLTPIFASEAAKELGTDISTEQLQLPQSGSSKTSTSNKLRSLILSDNLSVGFILWALALAFVLGGLHALAPGHGKTIVAAYLVGHRGRVSDAIMLGLIVTITHTASVFIIGLLVLSFEQFLPGKFGAYLEAVSGLLILIIGIWLFTARRRSATGYETEGLLAHTHEGDDENHNHHHHEHENSDHDDDHHHEEHTHIHSGKKHTHTHLPSSPEDKVTLGTILSLGITGGIVPCYDALLVLLLAIGLHRVALGLTILIAFSLGLATVLIIIGILVLKARPLIDRMTHGTKIFKALPSLSALLIAAIGLYMMFYALIKNGIVTFNF